MQKYQKTYKTLNQNKSQNLNFIVIVPAIVFTLMLLLEFLLNINK
jgi:hypothetical protein